MHNHYKVLFVCLGNICRSPMAESVFKNYCDSNSNLKFRIESAGTASYHIGESPDIRTLKTLKKNGINYFSTARQVKKNDFFEFDLILAMDHSNLADLEISKPDNATADLELFRDFDPTPENKIVPDPYYGQIDGFNEVFTIVTRTVPYIFKHLINNYGAP